MKVAINYENITWEAAALAARASVEHALSLGVNVCVAVVDRSGLLMAFLRMPGAPLHSTDIATDKAYTAASFGVPTGVLGQALSQHSLAVQSGVPLQARVVLFGGGLALKRGEICIGAIGVSGASEDQDIACAERGRDALEAIIG